MLYILQINFVNMKSITLGMKSLILSQGAGGGGGKMFRTCDFPILQPVPA